MLLEAELFHNATITVLLTQITSLAGKRLFGIWDLWINYDSVESNSKAFIISNGTCMVSAIANLFICFRFFFL